MSWKHALTTCLLGLLLVGTTWGAAPIRVLIVDGQNNHDWKSTTPVLKKQLEDSGLFQVDVATSPPSKGDMSGFQPNFAAYNVVVSNYTGDAWPEVTKKAFVDFVSGGGGLVIYHAANNAFAKWPEYNKMIGVGGWGGRNRQSGVYLRWRDGKVVRDDWEGPSGGHGPQHDYQVTIRNSDHPITKGLPPVFMHQKDELYSWLRGPAENVDLLATAFSDKEKRGSGEHEPMLITISYGKGRVFHTALGHHVEQCQCVGFITTFLRGTEWAATGKVTQKVPEDFPGPDEPVLRK